MDQELKGRTKFKFSLLCTMITTMLKSKIFFANYLKPSTLKVISSLQLYNSQPISL